MPLKDIIAKKIEAAKAERQARQAELDAIIAAAESEARDLNDDEAAKFAAAKESVLAADTDLDDLTARYAEAVELEERAAKAASISAPAAKGGAVVRNEARTYEPHTENERSFFADAYRSQFGFDPAAKERIERHMREVQVERRDVTSSTFNGLIPPLYLLDQAAELARAMRPFANVVPGYALPENGMSVVVTRVTTGTATAAQTTENSGATETNMVTTDITIPVVTIMGQQDLSRQAVERGAITDRLVFNDLLADYATKLDAQTINGLGSTGESKGILSAAAGSQTWTGTTVASFISKLNGALNDVASNRYAPATVIVMHPRRWHWLLAQSDSTGRNIVLPAQNMPENAAGIGQTGYGVVGTLAGLPVIADANVPVNLGTSTNEDRVIVTRLSDHALWERGVMTFQFDQAVNAPATIRLAVAGYHAFTAERYPAASSVVAGSGLATPSF